MQQERRRYASPLAALWNARIDGDLPGSSELFSYFDDLVMTDRLTSFGKEFFGLLRDSLVLRNFGRDIVFARSLYEAHDHIGRRFGENDEQLIFGYLTGGFEAYHHLALLDAVNAKGVQAMILGLEQSDYVRSKGREPVLSFVQKASIWHKLLPDRSILFPIPPRPVSVSADTFYDWVSRVIGVWRNERIVYVGSKDDPSEIKRARLRRAASADHVVEISVGRPVLHTSHLLSE